MPTRRRLLAVAGLAAASSGCMSALGNDGGDAASGDGEQSVGGSGDGAVRLERLSLQNNHDAGHQVQLAVEGKEGLLHMGTYELEAGSGTTVEGDWTGTTDAYRVNGRLDDGEIRSAGVTEGVGDGAECVRALLRIDDQGTLDIWNSAGCSS